MFGHSRIGALRGRRRAVAALLATAASLDVAVLAQSSLLRTRSAWPSAPLFLVAVVVGILALRLLPAPARLCLVEFAASARGRGWKLCLGLAVVACGVSLTLFATQAALTVGWLTWVLGVLLLALAGWFIDGRPKLRIRWREEWPWLVALAAITLFGAVVRLVDLGGTPFGLWFDEANNGLQVERILSDSHFRPVYLVGGAFPGPSLFWYLIAGSFQVFGPGMVALRIPSAIGGIVGIPAIYLLGRELFGRRVGLIAAGLLAGLVWHLTFSRLAFNSIWSVSLDALGLFLLVRALKTGSWTAAALCGISLGLGLHMYYTSRLMVIVAGCALLAFWLVRPRQRTGSIVRVVAAATCAGLLTTSPLIEYAVMQPTDFNARLASASVFSESSTQPVAARIADNLTAHVLMFNFKGDGNGRHNLPGAPELNFLLGGLFVLGLGLALARFRRPEYLILPIWAVLMLAGGVFSVSFEAPQSLRTIDEINVVVLLCAIPLGLLWDASAALGSSFARLGRAPAPRRDLLWPGAVRRISASVGAQSALALGALLAAALVSVSDWTDVHRYFGPQVHDSSAFAQQSADATFAGRALAALSPGTRVLMDDRLIGQPTIQFLAPMAGRPEAYSPNLLPLTTPEDTAVFLIGEDAPDMDYLRRLYPDATINTFRTPDGSGTVLQEVLVTPGEISAIQGVDAVFRPPDGTAPFQERVATPDAGWDQLPFMGPVDVSYDCALAAPDSGDYVLQVDGPRSFQLQIDRQPVSVTGQDVHVMLPRGLHHLELTATGNDQSRPPRLLWQPPSANQLSPVPASNLFTSPVVEAGLLGHYYANDTWSGPPTFQQIDPFISRYFQRTPLPLPFSIEWTGQLGVPADGEYGFNVTSLDTSQLVIDEQQVADDTPVTLTAGWHPIRLRYEAHTGYSHVELRWKAPGQGWSIVTSAYLSPSASQSAAQALPAPPAPNAPAAPPAGQGNASTQPAAQLTPAWQFAPGSGSRPAGVALDRDDNVYVVDAALNRVDKLDSAGHLLWTADTPAGTSGVQHPSAVALAPDGGALVLDGESGVISRFAPDGGYAGAFATGLPVYHPRGLTVGPDGDVYVADTGGGRVLRLSAEGKPVGQIGGPDTGLGQPTGVALTSDGDLIVVDPAVGKIVQFAASGAPLATWDFAKGPTVDGPQTAVDARSRVWVSDTNAGRLTSISAEGSARVDYQPDGGLVSPSGVAVGDEYVVVAEPAAGRVRAFKLPG